MVFHITTISGIPFFLGVESEGWGGKDETRGVRKKIRGGCIIMDKLLGVTECTCA